MSLNHRKVWCVMRIIKQFILLTICLGLLVSLTNSARSDVSPPGMPPGANLKPGEENTQVRMVSENVLIEVQEEAVEDILGIAHVTAVFTMLNLGEESERMAVRFPLSTNDGFSRYPEIDDLAVAVNNKLVSIRRVTELDKYDYPLPWAEFDVEFPPGEEVMIDVSYTLIAMGEYPYSSFAYLLETGAGWQGTIGSADLTVQLPYEANEHNVFIDSSPGWGHTTPGAVLAGREVRWHYEDFEPEAKHNLSIALVLPSAWTKVLAEQRNVQNDPLDGEAWGRLGKLYKEISRLRRSTRDDDGGQHLFTMSVEAYKQAVSLLPDDALWHAGFAELLFDYYYWDEYYQAERPGLLHAFHELALAYELKPNDPFILALLSEINSALPGALEMDGEGYVFAWLTATPTSQMSPTPSKTALPPEPATQTPVSRTPSPTPESEREQLSTNTVPPAPQEPTTTPETTTNRPLLPLCGSALVIPSAALLMRKKRRSQA
jgi:tetratricopeptide (TPR) repeat protein